jgi:hypothetical protein
MPSIPLRSQAPQCAAAQGPSKPVRVVPVLARGLSSTFRRSKACSSDHGSGRPCSSDDGSGCTPSLVSALLPVTIKGTRGDAGGDASHLSGSYDMLSPLSRRGS